MQAEHNSNIVRTIFNKEDIRDVTVDELLIAAAKYPYSSLLQLFYSRTLKDRNDPRYAASVAKTALYFSNPHWLHHQLQDKVDVFSSLVAEPAKYIKKEEAPLLREENEQPQPDETQAATAEFPSHEADQFIPAAGFMADRQPEEVNTEEPYENALESDDSGEVQISVDEASPEAEPADLQIDKQSDIPTFSEEQERVDERLDEKMVAEYTEETDEESQGQIITEEDIFEDAPATESATPATVETEVTEDISGQKPAASEMVSGTSGNPESTGEIPIYPEFDEHDLIPINPSEDQILIDAALTESLAEVQENGEHIGESSEKTETIVESAKELTVTESAEQIHATEPFADESGIDEKREETETLILQPEEKQEEPVTAESLTDVPEQIIPFTENEKLSDQKDQAVLSFEPLHTIDYFASQGIKLSLEEDNKDQLSNKLRSFTEWLRAMKKIHPEKLKNELDEKTELNIKTVAEHSNDQGEILTETMAEILHKQGLIDKALEVYEKLSLLNPSKSDYFAAKISALKAIGI